MTGTRQISFLAVVAITCHLSTSCVLLQERLPGVTLSDSNVISVLDSFSEAKIETARLAQNKATTPEVRAFAGRVLSEHRQLAEDNGRLAAELAVRPRPPALVSQLTKSHEQAMRTLGAASGPDFDRAYVEYEIRPHVKAFKFVEAAAETEGNPVLRQELVRRGPELLSHISAARALERHFGSEPQAAIAAR